MDLELTEEQNILKSSAQNFLKKECPPSVMRDMKDDERGYPQELWNKIIELGWLGVIIPEEYGYRWRFSGSIHYSRSHG